MAEKDENNSETVWQKSKSQFTRKRNSEYFDPCQEAADRSLRCLRRNGGDRAMCQDFFDAYKECKKSWVEERREADTAQKKEDKKSWF